LFTQRAVSLALVANSLLHKKNRYFHMHKLITKLSNRFCLDDDEGGAGGGGSKLQFIGLVDVQDENGLKAAKKLQKLLTNYERRDFRG